MQGQLLAIPPHFHPQVNRRLLHLPKKKRPTASTFHLEEQKTVSPFLPLIFSHSTTASAAVVLQRGLFSVLTLKAAFPFIFSPLLACISSLSARGGRGCNQESSSSSKDVTHRLPWVGHQRGGDTKGKRRPPSPSPPTMTEKKGALPSPLYFILLSPS